MAITFTGKATVASAHVIALLTQRAQRPTRTLPTVGVVPYLIARQVRGATHTIFRVEAEVHIS